MMGEKTPGGVESPRVRIVRRKPDLCYKNCNSFFTNGQRPRKDIFLEKQGVDFTVEFL